MVLAPHPPARVGPRPAFLYALTATGILTSNIVVPVVPDIVGEFGAGPAAGGVVLAIGSAPGIVMAPVLGWLADRLGRRRVLLACLLVVAATGCAHLVVGSMRQLLVLRFVQGLASVSLSNVALVLIGDHWEDAERFAILARNAAVLAGAAAAGPLVGGLLAEIGGWRSIGLVSPLVLGLAWTARSQVAGGRAMPWPPGPAAAPGDPAEAPELAGVAWWSASAGVVAVVVVACGHFLLYFGLLQSLLPFTAAVLGLGPGVRGLLVGAASLPAIAASLRAQRRTVAVGAVTIRAFGLFAAAALLVVAWRAPVALLGAAVLVGFGSGAATPVLQSRIAVAAPAHARGLVTALWASSVRVGQTLGPLAAGAGVQGLGLDPALVLVAATGLACAVALRHRWSRAPTFAGRPG